MSDLVQSVLLSSLAARSPDWLAGLASVCERMVHPSVDDPATRARHARLAGVLLASPFLGAAAIWQILPTTLGVAGALALSCALIAGSWLAVVTMASTGRTSASPFVYAAASLLLAGLIAAAGGLQSPFAIMALALLFEPLWLRRDGGQAMPAAAAATVLIVGQGLAGWIAPESVAAASGWHWLLPAVYGATVLARCKFVLDAANRAAREPAEAPAEALFDIAVLRLCDNGDVADARGAVETLLGVAPQMLLSTGLFERIHVADRIAYLSAVADMREGAPSRMLEIRLRTPIAAGGLQGTHRTFAVEMVRTGKPDAPFAALLRSVSGHDGAQERPSAAQDVADGGEIAKGRFIAAVSHELRTPLNAILGFSDMLLGDMAGPFADPRQRDYVGLIRESGGHLLSLVNSILDMSKIESGAYEIRPEPFRLGEAVETSRSMLAFQADAKSVSLTTSVAPGTGEVCADRRAVKQMLINLVANAVKFTPQGGAVTIGTRRLGSRVIFWVSDTGIGIAEDDLSRLGRPFAQVQNDYTRQFEGTGLGLAVVKGLVALHKGTMTIESAEGEGTMVTISLPADGPLSPARRRENPMMLEETHGAFRKTA